MNSWFTVKVKYTKQLENGVLKRVSEPYLLAAMSFTDAEARIYEELGSVIKGEFNVVGITRTELHDIFAYDDADVWYKVKVTYEVEGDGDEKGKKISQNFLVSAFSVKDAYDRITESLSSLMVDFQIPSITVSPIVEIFPYHENLDKEIERMPILAEELLPTKGKVFSAPGEDIDDQEILPEEEESELEDEYTDEE
jgi:hypothetical protein